MELEKVLTAINRQPDAPLYRECLYEMIEACAEYVGAVTKMEAYRHIPLEEGAQFREELSRRDKSRSIVHNDLISKIRIVNRICGQIGIDPLCGDDLSRAEYGDLAFGVVKDFFENRVR